MSPGCVLGSRLRRMNSNEVRCVAEILGRCIVTEILLLKGVSDDLYLPEDYAEDRSRRESLSESNASMRGT
jgi:hypothetical protein